MSRLRTLGPRVATLDTRKAKPLPKRTDPHYGTADHAAWAKQVKQRAGYRCEHVEGGTRCERSAARGDTMYADHIVELKDDRSRALDPTNGACKCAEHNVRKGIQARANRMTS
jgi:hypothetical protein